MSGVTMADVARAAGVNKGTVSRALRGDRRVSAQTRRRVWDAAKALGYQLDAVASGLSSRRTGVVGVAVERLDSPWTGAFLAALCGVLSRFKIEPLLLGAGREAWAPANVVRRVESRKADALIWVGERPLPECDPGVPVLRVGRTEQGARSRIWIDERGAAGRVLSLAGGRPCLYRPGAGALMGFLRALEGGGGSGDPFVITDGEQPADGVRPGLVCADEQRARWLRVPCLRFPSRELGALAARLSVNLLRGRGACPRTLLARPALISASGERILDTTAPRGEKGVQYEKQSGEVFLENE